MLSLKIRAAWKTSTRKLLVGIYKSLISSTDFEVCRIDLARKQTNRLDRLLLISVASSKELARFKTK